MNGTLVDPYDLTTALTNPYGNIKENHTIWMLGGVYSGNFNEHNKLVGVAIKKHPTETPIIDGSFYTSGQVSIHGLIVYDADFTDRESSEAGSLPSDIPLYDGIRAENPAQATKMINNVIHDCRQGIFKDGIIPSVEFYGNLIYYNGWSGPDKQHGHGIYASNANDTALRIINNVIHSQFGYGLHCWAENGDGSIELLRNIQIEGCTLFGNDSGSIIGGSEAGSTVRTSWMKNCCIKENIQIGGITSGCTEFALTGNVIIGNLAMLFYGPNPTITGNKFFGTVAIKNGDTGQTLDAPTVFPDNEYLSAIPDHIDLRANIYDEKKAKLTIFNGSSANTVDVDVSVIFGVSGTVKAHNVQDYFTDIQTLTITAGVITVNMQAINRTVAIPQGWTAPATTFPEFGSFVLEKQ
jgi:hypothetical protein